MKLEVAVKKQFAGGFCADFAFTVENDRCGIFGQSGSGKTTLMYMLAGLLAPDSGTIFLDGRVLFDSLAGVNLPPEKRKIGIVFQHARLFPHMNVKQNLLFGFSRLSARERVINQAELLDILKLDSLLKRSVGGLSGGERQRVALARTLLACPRLILLDEPLTGLDDSLKAQIIPYLQKVFARFSIPFLFISHSLEEMRLMTEQVLLVEKGGLRKIVATEELIHTALDGGCGEANNLLLLSCPQKNGQLTKYFWKKLPVWAAEFSEAKEEYFSLSSKSIVLFKDQNICSSCENMLPAIVRTIEEKGLFSVIELDCEGQTLRVELVTQTLQQQEFAAGDMLTAAFCASSLQKVSVR